ncbi:MAG: hypothetical protein BGN96_17115 [Bacteroidales bacterium 45-6]|nr:MAG: hypothetical protein BGN96_17115 [Bacteroidales bacterium 45-6]
MAKDDDNKLAFGLILMIFGLIFLVDKTGLLDKIPNGEAITNFRVLILIAGGIFLFAKREKTWGIILTGLGVILNADFFFGWFASLSAITVPVMLIILGVILVFRSQK